MSDRKKQQEGNIRHYSVISDIWFYIKHFKKYAPKVLVFCAVEIILGAILPLIGIYLPKIAVGMVEKKAQIEEAIIILGGIILLNMILKCINGIVCQGKYLLYNIQRSVFISMLCLKSMRVKYEYSESGEMKKVYWRAINSMGGGDWSASNRMVTGTVSLIINVLCFILYSTVIGSLNIWMLLFVITFSLLYYLIGRKRIDFQQKLMQEMSENDKCMSVVKASMGNTKGAKDIRIFGMNEWLIKLRNQILAKMRITNTKYHKKNCFYDKIGFVIGAVRNLCAYGYLLYEASRGNLTASEFVLYFGAITGFSSFVDSILGSILGLKSAAEDTAYLRTYLDLPEPDESKCEDADRNIDMEELLKEPLTIEFRDVSFRYKEMDSEQEVVDTGKVCAEVNGVEVEDTGDEAGRNELGVFEHFNLTIHAGEKLALVGVNGAGKTTLVKLLCGMYEPDEGEILINGISQKEFAPNELYRLFSAVFQEQLILPFTIGENVAMDRAENVDAGRAWEALDKAGLKTALEKNGWNLKTYMTKQIFKNGAELSGGQQQRLLLARALYKDAPILVLDEPTAALDPIAESEVYESYNKYSEGKTSIFISHRLASTRFSDRIIMLEKGRIIESGSHEELMQMNGAYADMYQIQSSYYDQSSNFEQGIYYEKKEVCGLWEKI